MLRIPRKSENPPEKETFDEPEGFMTLEEAAELLRMSEKTVRGLAKAGKIPAYRPNKKWLFKRSEIENSSRVA